MSDALKRRYFVAYMGMDGIWYVYGLHKALSGETSHSGALMGSAGYDCLTDALNHQEQFDPRYPTRIVVVEEIEDTYIKGTEVQ